MRCDQLIRPFMFRHTFNVHYRTSPALGQLTWMFLDLLASLQSKVKLEGKKHTFILKAISLHRKSPSHKVM